jgi:hypothetical protein
MGGGSMGKSARGLRLVAVLASVMMLAGGLDVTHAAAAAGPKRQLSAIACSEVFFLGARGSGELPTKQFQGMGPEVDKMATVVRGVLKADGITLVRTLNVGYPADSVDDLVPTKYELALFAADAALAVPYYYQHSVKKYLASINEGITNTISEAKYVRSQCPHALLILAGYSQGAMVMHQAERQLAAAHDTGVLGQITGTLLLGDGDRISHTAAREFGTSTARSQGIRTYLHQNSDKDVTDPAATANICNAGDIVCDFGRKTVLSWKTGLKVHESYTTGAALTDAATWIAQVTGRRLSGKTVLLPGLTLSAACGPGTIAVAASSDARHILLEGCSGALVRLDRYTGAEVDATTGSHGKSYPDDGAGEPQLSGDGTIATYFTLIGGRSQVIVHNLTSGKMSVASSASSGITGNAASDEAVLSSSGQWLLFSSDASNLVPGISSDGTGSHPNIFRKNLTTGAVSLAVKTDGPPNGGMSPGGISDDGDVIAFDSTATNIIGTAPVADLRDSAYLRDLSTETVRQLLYQPAGTQTQGSLNASISANGAEAAFLGMDDNGFATSVMSCDLSAGLVKPPSCTLAASAFPVFDLHLAANGSAMEYSAANTAVSSSRWQVFRVGLAGGSSSVASVNDAGDISNADTGNVGGVQGISGDGSTIFFSSAATNLNSSAVDGQLHAFVRT